VLEECLVNPSFSDYFENYHFSHDCEANQLKMLLQQPLGRVLLITVVLYIYSLSGELYKSWISLMFKSPIHT